MSAPRVIAELVITGFRVLGKATAAAGAQAVRNFKHKPDGAPSSAPIGTGSSKSQLSNQMQMSLEEAHLILNVKKEDPMDIIQKHYEQIFAANSPPPEVKAATTPAAAGPSRATPSSRKPTTKGVTHSHYLQSKVYRALERIKAERAEAEPAVSPEAGETSTPPGQASGSVGPGAGIPPEGSTFTPPPPGSS